MATVAPFGSWRSRISARDVAAGAVPLGNVELHGDDVYWLEGKPLEGGRYVVVRHAADGTTTELSPSSVNVRTRVHEYGGGAYTVHGNSVFFSNFADQRLYRQDGADAPRPITPEPPIRAGVRFADTQVTPDGRLLIGVREVHTDDGREAVNDLFVLPTDGSAEPRSIVAGADFYAAPRISPDGRRLAWQSWDHPNMPWDSTSVWVADLAEDGSVSNARCVAGGEGESAIHPRWSPSGVLHLVADRSGWWNLYRVADDGLHPIAPSEAELGVPQWVFGLEPYTFLADGSIACIVTRDGLQHLAIVRDDRLESLDLPYTAYGGRLRSKGSSLAFIAASPTSSSAVVVLDVSTGMQRVLRRSREQALESAFVSQPRPITFPTADGEVAHALYYPPSNPDFEAPPGERPPLLVESHGGPTSMALAQLSTEYQFWTSRGFGVVDVNYGGSTGYGRAYRERLRGRWGVVDTQDCISAARYLAERGEVDGQRLAIRGGSAGGYTTLCALTFHDEFAAGASYYGVADCEALARDTHKFESRYLDGLIGPYPAEQELYRQRSPIHFTDRLSCPVILFQGLEDRVVPPSQAEAMAEALRAKGLPFAYLAFEGEQHGFRKAETIQRTLEAELYFYGRVFGFTLADPVEPVAIENLPARS